MTGGVQSADWAERGAELLAGKARQRFI
jgi:hypothetical protein